MNNVLTFDRYLIRSFLHVFCTCFIATFGLMIVIDLLENLDEFLAANGAAGNLSLLQNIGRYYAYQSVFFLDRAGATLTVISVVVILILFQRSGELYPLLAAGVPMYRVLLPLVCAAVSVSGLLVLNQELVIPRVAFAAYDSRGGTGSNELRVEPVYDYASRISINGKRLLLAQRVIEEAEFVLPAPSIVGSMETLQATRAVHKSLRKGGPSGWHLQGTSKSWQELPLTEFGRELILPGAQPNELFVVTAVTCDQLYRRNSSFAFLSTQELLRRIRSPAFGIVSAQRLVAHLHSRFVQPLMNVICVLLVMPLMVRRESSGIVIDSAISAGVLAGMFVVTQGAAYLGQAHYLAPDLAAWLPVVFGGSWAAWLSGVIRS